jgi:hypothetical protein
MVTIVDGVSDAVIAKAALPNRKLQMALEP